MLKTVLISLLCCIAGIALGFVGRWIYAKFKLTSAEQKAKRLEEEAVREAEAKAKEIILETRDKLQKEQQAQESEARERRFELQKSERRLLQKEENLDHKQQELDALKRQLGERDAALSEKEKTAEERLRMLDAELEKVYKNYPVIWKDANAKPKLCFMGCPHMSLEQLKSWTDKVEAGLKDSGNKKVVIPTVFTAAPAVLKEFEKTPYAARLKATGVITSYICPLMYMNNPLSGKMPVITSSNKLRTYTTARYYTDDEILLQITKGGQ